MLPLLLTKLKSLVALLLRSLEVKHLQVLVFTKLEDFVCCECLPIGLAGCFVFGHQAAPKLAGLAAFAWPDWIRLTDEFLFHTSVALEYNDLS